MVAHGSRGIAQIEREREEKRTREVDLISSLKPKSFVYLRLVKKT